MHFLSYSQHDTVVIQKVLNKISAEQNIIFWRDVESLRAGDLWPKKIGDAINNSDSLVLIWSKNSSRSKFVEIEWNIAFALRKKIVIYTLDKTPIPSSLSAMHAEPLSDSIVIPALNTEDTLNTDLDTTREIEILSQIKKINKKNPDEVLRIIRKVQSCQNVPSSTNINVADKIIIQKTGALTIVVIITVSLMIALLIPRRDTAQKINDTWRDLTHTKEKCEYTGRVVSEKDKTTPIANLDVIVMGGKGRGRTDSNGEFIFYVEEACNKTVRVLIQQNGKDLYDSFQTLPGGNTIAVKFPTE